MITLTVVLLALLTVVVLAAWARVSQARQALEAHQARYRWTDDDLAAARRDGVNRSHSVVSGRVHEQLAPLLPEFLYEFNPRDARFLGSPVDFVVFDGMDAGRVDRVVFVEVKTGRSELSTRERQVRRAVQAGLVEWRLLKLTPAEALQAALHGSEELREGEDFPA